MAKFKEVAARLQGMRQFRGQKFTVNDVVMAVLSKAMRAYFTGFIGEDERVVRRRRIRAQFLVNLRKRGGCFLLFCCCWTEVCVH